MNTYTNQFHKKQKAKEIGARCLQAHEEVEIDAAGDDLGNLDWDNVARVVSP